MVESVQENLYSSTCVCVNVARHNSVETDCNWGRIRLQSVVRNSSPGHHCTQDQYDQGLAFVLLEQDLGYFRRNFFETIKYYITFVANY